MKELPSLELDAKLGDALLAGHPWVYKNHVPARFTAEAGWVRIQAGSFRGFAIWDPDSVLALRVYSRLDRPTPEWFLARVREAFALRNELLKDGRTTAYRLVYGEGDFLPGVVVDVYEGFAVIVLDSAALSVLVADLVAALVSVLAPRGILLKQRKAGGEPELVWGRALPQTLVVSENGLRLRANLQVGQKTGLFLDHRDNRAFIEQQAQGKRVLNLFAYSGAFSLYAARGQADSVTSVDIAADAMSDARENFRLNGFETERHAFVVKDVFEYLRECTEARELFDLVIVDPPSFARRLDQVKQAKKAYLKLNMLACRVLRPGGMLASASCTARLTPEDFRAVVGEAAWRSQFLSQVVRDAGHALDHPISGAHPEGRYLKFVASKLTRFV